MIVLACDINLDNSKSDKINTELEALKLQSTKETIQLTQTAISKNHQILQTQIQSTPEPISNVIKIKTTPTDSIMQNLLDGSVQYISETIPDGAQMNPGEKFIKSWRVKNRFRSWDKNYQLVFVSGDQMGGPIAMYLTHEVKQYDIVDLSVNLIAPSTYGEFTGYWKIQSPEGNQFGNLWVKINVIQPEK